MAGEEKDKLAQSVKNYFQPQDKLKEEAEKLKKERQAQAETETVLSSPKAE